MGLLDKIFGKKAQVSQPAPSVGWKTFTELNPVFSSYEGGIYEMEIIRAVIQRFSDACSKLKPEVRGVENLNTLNGINEGDTRVTSMDSIQRIIKTNPNSMMTWPQFLSRCATLYEVDDTIFIAKVYGRDMRTVKGVYPVVCAFAEVVDAYGEPYVRFHYATGDTMAVELSDVAIISKFQYRSEFFGEPNCLDPTMQLIHAQNEAQENAIKNGAKVRFIGKLTGQVREDDMAKKRERFMEDNFANSNNGGMMVYDQTWDNVQQIQPQSYTMSSDEMALINNNVYNYFGINEDILQNHYSEDTWGAWYEGRIEPFAVKLGEALTRLIYTDTQIAKGKHIEFSANRLAYASNASKRNMVRDMVDRGLMSINEGREVLQLPPVVDGDIRVIRGEYINSTAVSDVLSANGGGRMPKNDNEKDRDPGGNDKIYKDSDSHEQDDFNGV